LEGGKGGKRSPIAGKGTELIDVLLAEKTMKKERKLSYGK